MQALSYNNVNTAKPRKAEIMNEDSEDYKHGIIIVLMFVKQRRKERSICNIPMMNILAITSIRMEHSYNKRKTRPSMPNDI